MWLHYLITLVVALTFGLLFMKLKVPAGMLMGAFLSVGALNLIWGGFGFPAIIRMATQSVVGAFIGAGMRKRDLKLLPTIGLPVVVLMCGAFVISILASCVIYLLTPFDLVTAMFSCIPGGLSDMPLISVDAGANAPAVAVMHMIRLIVVMSTFPFLLGRITKKHPEERYEAQADPAEEEGQPHKLLSKKVRFLITLGIGLLFGIPGYLTGIPAGGLSFSLVGVCAFNILTGQAYIPGPTRRVAQLFSGSVIGGSVSASSLTMLSGVFLPAVLMVVSYVFSNLLLGYAMAKVGKISLSTALFAAAPGGAADMALIADDLGGNPSQVSMIQILRLAISVGLFPGLMMSMVPWLTSVLDSL